MEDKRDFLFDLLPKNCVCAEVGVWKGEFSQKILDHLNPQKLYLIDPWLYQPSYKESWYGGGEAKSQDDMDKIYSYVVERLKNDSRIKILKISSVEAQKTFSYQYFDFIYIDGNHLYEFVKQDLELFYGKVKSNGFIVGDDYNSPNSWWQDGVTKAVDEFVEKNNLKLIIENNQFIIRKEI